MKEDLTKNALKLLVFQEALHDQNELFHLSLCYHLIHVSIMEMKDIKDLGKQLKELNFDRDEYRLLYNSVYSFEKPFNKVRDYYRKIVK